MSKPFHITKLWAWVSADRTGEEGIPAYFDVLQGATMPMIGSDEERIRELRPMAQELADRGYPMRLVRFETQVVIEELKPEGPIPPHLYREIR